MYAFILGSFGSVKMVSVGPCSINQIEKGDSREVYVPANDRHVF